MVGKNSKVKAPALDASKVEKKIKLASDLFAMAFKMKCFVLRKKFPEWSDQEIKKEAYALIEKGCS